MPRSRNRTLSQPTHPKATMATQQTQQTQAEKPKNGGSKNQETAPATNHVEPSDGTSKRRGVVPTMPMGMLYTRADGRVVAGIYHPADGTSYVETGKGVGSAKGALEDSGFVLSGLTLDGPEWLSDLLPPDCVLLGYCSVKGFPLPQK